MAERFYWIAVTEKQGVFAGKRILLQHYGDEKMRTRVMEDDEINGADHWKIASLLNAAYKAGREHAFEDLRDFIGIK